MTFTSMVSFVCNKVSKTDTFSQARCLEYVLARHKMIYEAFDWKAAQTLLQQTIIAGGGTITSVNVTGAHHILSVRLDGKLLDPVTPSFIFDRETTETDEILTAGTPRYYEEFLDMTSQTRSIRFFPPLADDGNNHALVILAKAPYNDTWTQPAIPATENALIAHVTGDMWEYLHEVGKAQAKFTEAGQLLDAAKAQDTPGAQRPRRMRRMTARGNSLGELRDSACSLIGDFTPDTRNTISELIRRCYQQVWNAANWPETMVTDMPTTVNGIAVVSHLIDRIIAVRANLSNNLLITNYQMLEYEDSSVILGLTPEAFGQDGTPISYNMLLPIGLPTQFVGSQIKLQFFGSETQKVTIRGESNGVEVSETLIVGSSLVTSGTSYDIIYTIQKPVSVSPLGVQDLSGNSLMTLQPSEHSRKYPRLQVLPDYDQAQYPDRAIFVLGKRGVPQFLEEGDVAELSGVESILINTSVANYFSAQGKLDQAQAFKAEAASAIKTLIDLETMQQTYHPRILPYTEPDANAMVGLG